MSDTVKYHSQGGSGDWEFTVSKSSKYTRVGDPGDSVTLRVKRPNLISGPTYAEYSVMTRSEALQIADAFYVAAGGAVPTPKLEDKIKQSPIPAGKFTGIKDDESTVSPREHCTDGTDCWCGSRTVGKPSEIKGTFGRPAGKVYFDEMSARKPFYQKDQAILKRREIAAGSRTLAKALKAYARSLEDQE